MKMALNERIINFSPEQFRKAAEKYREDLKKRIYPGGKEPSEEEIKEATEWCREFPNNLTQKQKDMMFEAYQKVRAEYENEDRNEGHQIEDVKEWMRIHTLSDYYIYYKTIELYESGVSIKEIAEEFDTFEDIVRFHLKMFHRI